MKQSIINFLHTAGAAKNGAHMPVCYPDIPVGSIYILKDPLTQ